MTHINSGLLISRTFLPHAGFRRSRSATDHTFCIRQKLEKKWEYNEAVHRLFVDCKKAYDSFTREVLYNILIEFGVPTKLVRLINMCLNKTLNRVQVSKYLSDMIPINPFSARGPIYRPPLCLRKMREADVSADFFQALQ